MGRKVNPNSFRIGINKPWNSVWYAGKKGYQVDVIEDYRIREYLKKKLFHAGISKIVIERMGLRIRISLHTSRPGIVIGKKGSEVEKLKASIYKLTKKEAIFVIREIRRPELDAVLLAESVAQQLVHRIAFRRAMKKAVFQSLKAGAQGIKIAISGRLGGAEMARTEWYIKGRVPLQTIRADIDYGFAEALTTYGLSGVKVWIYKGEILGSKTEKVGRGAEQDVNAQ